MNFFDEKSASLLLEDGTYFKGKAVGKIGHTIGEICFNTGMTGYQEVFTDPSYYGQILACTNVHIGNYGIRHDESQANHAMIAGLIVRNYTNQYSRHQANTDLQDFLLQHSIVAISDIDTRALVTHIRERGAMNAIISSETDDREELMRLLSEAPSMKGLELSSKVSTTGMYHLAPDEDPLAHVAVLDLGIKRNILHQLVAQRLAVTVYPAMTPFETIQASSPDAYFISNGPGDPAAMPYAVEAAQHFIHSQKPTFGICLGHQIIAQALNIPTFKMFNGHRGLNHPVLNLETKLSEITSQNHGFGVVPEAVADTKDVIVTHRNLNDQSIEGIRHASLPVFSVQYHPEAAPGPHDSRYLFAQFQKDIVRSLS